MNKADQAALKKIQKQLSPFSLSFRKIYPKSFHEKDGLLYGLIRIPQGKRLLVLGERRYVRKDPFLGRSHHREGTTLKVCELTPENTSCLMDLFPFTRPVSLREHPVTVGTGDRLGVASPGHIRAVKGFPVRPVLAQQSVRENKQTGRSFAEVTRDAAWAVFQEDYQLGYGADGDHLKQFEEIAEALHAGVSMVTLDLSEKLQFSAFTDSLEKIEQAYRDEIGEEDSKVLSHLFLNKTFTFKGPEGRCAIQFDEESLMRNALLFYRAIDFTEKSFHYIRSIQGNRKHIDFEISVDETPFPTSPANHLFLIIELNQRGVSIDGLAPRFVGEFQKGIDYQGDLKTFRLQFYQHCLIARDYGNYKISIHSGSDKFSVFPIMGKLASEGLHLKTAGTSWLEAMRLIARKAPALYREMHRYALSIFHEATKLYHVTTDLGRIPKLEERKDRDLPKYLNEEDSRQLIHLTYGYQLHAKNEAGKYLFREKFFETLTEFEEEYGSLLERHIRKHILSLGVKKEKKHGTSRSRNRKSHR